MKQKVISESAKINALSFFLIIVFAIMYCLDKL
jgi:hypothetical protein